MRASTSDQTVSDPAAPRVPALSRRGVLAAGAAALLVGGHPRAARIVAQEGGPAPDVTLQGADPARTGVHPGPGPSGTPVERWRYVTQDRRLAYTPVLAEGVLYVAAREGGVYALDAVTGEERWSAYLKRQSNADFPGSPSISGDSLLVAAGRAGLVAFETATGAERWRFEPSERGTNGSPLVLDGRVYVATDPTGNSILVALDATTGEEIWRYETKLDLITSDAASAAGVVYLTGEYSGAALIAALDAADGREIWRVESPTAGTTPVIAGDALYVGDPEGTYYAIATADGSVRWSATVGGDFPGDPSVAGGLLLAATREGLLVAVDAAGGAERWRAETGNTEWTTTAISGETVYAGGATDLIAFDLASGAEQWRVATGEATRGMAVSGGMIYVGGYEGTVIALGDA